MHNSAIESFFALLKRGHNGISGCYSKKHMHRYCHEFDLRWDQRKLNDGERMLATMAGTEGKRLKYREPFNAR